jgi:hypothetical protein
MELALEVGRYRKAPILRRSYRDGEKEVGSAYVPNEAGLKGERMRSREAAEARLTELNNPPPKVRAEVRLYTNNTFGRDAVTSAVGRGARGIDDTSGIVEGVRWTEQPANVSVHRTICRRGDSRPNQSALICSKLEAQINQRQMRRSEPLEVEANGPCYRRFSVLRGRYR